jgi:hypothetical protein
MGANVQPQFTQAGNISSVLFGGTALATSDGSGGTYGTSMQIAFTAGANDSYVEAIRILAVASTAATATAATVVRIYVTTTNTGSTSTSNAILIAELALPAITADQTTTATNWYDLPLGFRLASGTYLACSSHIVNNASTNLRAVVFGANY